jgi:carboxylesterase type B
VDVMAPAGWKQGDKKVPVLVRIHGGGYVQGQSRLEDGYSLLRHSRGGIVFVSIQYRLGVYGFLASEAVKSDGVANAGLLDQRLALNWVSKYIGKFGGDNEKIVVDGGNAGGGSVGLHLMMFGGKREPPFSGAIAGSFGDSCLVSN